MAPRKRPRGYGSLVGILAKHLDNAMRYRFLDEAPHPGSVRSKFYGPPVKARKKYFCETVDGAATISPRVRPIQVTCGSRRSNLP